MVPEKILSIAYHCFTLRIKRQAKKKVCQMDETDVESVVDFWYEYQGSIPRHPARTHWASSAETLESTR